MKTEQINALITSLSPPQATLIREKPKMGCDYNFGITKDDINDYQKAMQDYELSQVPLDIENNGYEINGVWITFGIESIAKELKLHQTVQIVRTDNGCKIVKIETLNIGTNKSQNTE